MFSRRQGASVLVLVAGLTAASIPAPAVAAAVRAPREVTVVNDPTSPVPVRNVAEERREPFQAQVNFRVPMGFVANGDGVRVPAGKRFVVEYASLYVRDFPSRTVVRAWVEATSGPGTVRHYFVPARTGLDSGPAAITVGAQPLRLYGNAETFVSILVEISNATEGDAVVEGSLSGYLVDIP